MTSNVAWCSFGRVDASVRTTRFDSATVIARDVAQRRRDVSPARPGPARPDPAQHLARPRPDRCGPRDTLSLPVRSGQIEICHTSSSSRLSVIDAATVRSSVICISSVLLFVDI